MDEDPQSPWGKEGNAVGAAGLPPQGNHLQQADVQRAPLSPLQLHFFSRLYFWKEPRQGVMIFQNKKDATPSPKKVTCCTSKGSPHRLGGSAAKLHPITAAWSKTFCQDFPPLSCLGQLPKSLRCATLASSALLEHQAHLELLKPKYPPLLHHLPHSQSQILPELKQAQSQEGVPGWADSLLHFSLISGELE